MVWYSQVFQNFPQFIVIRTVNGFGIVNKTEVDVFLELSCFFDDPADVGNLSLVPLPFQKYSRNNFGRNINNLRYADDTTLKAESEEELKHLLMKVKEDSEKIGLNSTFIKLRSWHLVPSLHGT